MTHLVASFVRKFSVTVALVPLVVLVRSAQTASTASQVAQSAVQSSPPISVTTSASGWMDVRLARTLHSRKLQAGDAVEANVIAGSLPSGLLHTVKAFPRGAKVIGRVTEAKARSKGDEASSLGIVFEKVRFRDGQELTIYGVIYYVTRESAPTVSSPGDLIEMCSSGGPQPMPVPCHMQQYPSTQSPDPAKPDDPRAPGIPRTDPLSVDPGPRKSSGIQDTRDKLTVGSNGVVTSTAKEVEMGSNLSLRLGVTIM